jgi:apolipoprotein D and lipocalin family protein
MKKILAMLLLLITACTGIPANIQPVKGFQLDHYLGKWYEIARLEHSFERDLTQVTATYSVREDGSVKVINRGYLPAKKEWKEAEGTAYFMQQPDVGYLKVSFFGPFYGSYIVIALDKKDYQYSLVTSSDQSYLWILARTPHLNPQIQAELVAQAKALGFETDKLIYPEQK